VSNLDKDYMTFPCGCKFKVKDWNIKPYDGLPKLELDFYNIPFSCQATWELIASGRTRGIFQLESNLGRTYARKLEAETIDHLAALTAVLRPGCMSCQFEGKSMTNHFVDRKQNLEPVSYQESRLEQFLNTTFGVMIYQEQMIAFSKALASYTPEQANSLRKCVSGDTHFVSKTRGWISINRLIKEGYNEDLFLVMDEYGKQSWKKIKQIWFNGNKAVNDVRCDSGLSVKATGEHQFLTNNSWKARSRLTTDDRIICAQEVEWDGEDRISESLAMLIAGLLTEGYFVDKYRSHFTNYDETMMRIFREAYEKEFGVTPTTCGHQITISKENKEKISKYLSYAKSGDKIIPDVMMGMTKETTRKFLAFMLNAEGGVTEERGQFEYCSKSKLMIEQVCLLLIRFGIYSFILKKWNEEYQSFYYRLYINDFDNQSKLINEFGDLLLENKKCFIIKNLLDRKNSSSKNSNCTIPNNIVKKLIDQYPHVARKEGGNVYSRSLTRKRFQRLCEKSGDNSWKKLLNGKQRYAEIKNLDEHHDQVKVYDFTIDDENTPYIIANGMVIHNCVGKKDVEGLFKLEESFIQGCVKNGITEESARKIFDDIKSSGRYLFNACISGDTIINVFNGMETFFTVEEMLRIKADESFAIDSGRLTEHKDWNKNGNYGCGWSMQEDGLIRPNIIQDIQFSGIRHVYKITLSNGYCIKVTDNHKFPTPDGMKTTSELNINDELYIRGEIIENGVYTSEIKIIISIEDVGRENTYDVTMCTPHNHNFVANQGIVTCNSHAYSYGHISYITAYLKAHFPLHFFTAYLKRAKDSDELRELMSEISLFNITIKNPSIGNLCKKFNIKDGYIQYGYAELKNVGLQTAETLISSVEELEKKLNKTAIEFTWYEFLLFLSTKIDSRSVYNLISCGLLDNTGISRQRQLAEYSAFVSLTGKPELKFIEEEGNKYEDLINLIEGMLKAGKTTIVKKKEVFVPLIKGQRRAKVESILSGLYNPGTSWEDSVNWVCDVETEIMGTAISKSKTKSFERLGNIKCLDFCLGKGNNGIRLVAEVIDVDERIIKSGNNQGKKFANTVLKDSSGEVECTIFSNDWQDLRSDIIKGNVLLIHGRRNQDKSLKIEKVELL